MSRLAFFIITLLTLFSNCTEKPVTKNNSPSFKSFVISYSNGWAKGFSIFIDSSKIYFSPQQRDTTYYGILPDSIFKMVDTISLKIQSNKNIKSKVKSCVDCSVLAMMIITKNDTIRIKPNEDFDKLFYPLINNLQKFIDSSKHQYIHAFIRLETESIVSPPPPKFITPD
ncbi:MAG: hypothetical protein WAU24_05470 [Chitinophagaceae bacterium]